MYTSYIDVLFLKKKKVCVVIINFERIKNKFRKCKFYSFKR